MRWKPINTRTVPWLLEWTIIIITAPTWVPLVLGLWSYHEFRKRCPGPGEQWEPWFAWYPKRVWDGPNDAVVWLETIERQRRYGSMYYRFIQVVGAER